MFLCSTQLSMKFQLVLHAKRWKNKDFSLFIMPINIKLPTIVGLFVCFDSLGPINNLSVIKGRVFY